MLLPPQLRDQAERLVQRAVLTLNQRAEYEEVWPPSFLMCVLKAAEMGLAIDGRLAHAVVYNTKYKDEQGVERWRKEAQLQVDYKGMVAVAKRSGTIRDCFARLVRDNDEFELRHENGQDHLRHAPNLESEGEVIGAFAIFKLSDNPSDWHYEWMSFKELAHVRAKSKASDKGPWVTDTGEMQKKTVIKRGLKLFQEDPAIQKMLEVDDDDYGEIALAQETTPPPPGRYSARAPRSAPKPTPGDNHEQPPGPDLPPESEPPAPPAPPAPKTEEKPKEAPPAQPAPEQKAKPQLDAQDQMGLQDLVDDLTERISNAQQVSDLDSVSRDLLKHQIWLGSHYANVHGHFQSKKTALAKAKK